MANANNKQKQAQAAQAEEIRALILAQQTPASAPKEKPAPEPVDKSLHALAVKMATADTNMDKALNAVYATFKAYALAALPIIERMPAHTAALQDIHKVFGEARKPAAVQRITMLNNMRKIAYGAPATRDTAAQAPQGVERVHAILDACTSLPALKKELSAAKAVRHAAAGVARTAPSTPARTASAPAATVKAEDVQIPGTRAEAIKAACRMLKFISDTFLSAGTDADLVLEVADVVEHLQAKAA